MTTPDPDPVRLNAELDRQLFELQSLLKAGESLHGELDVEQLCHLFMTMVRERVQVDKLAVLLHEDSAQLVSVEAVQGLEDEALDLCFSADPGILWSLLSSGEPFSVVDLDGRPRFPEIFEVHELERLQGQLWIPLVMPGTVVGVLSVATTRSGRPVPSAEHAFLHRLASRAALAIHTAMLYRSIQIARRDLDRSLHQLSLLFDVTRALSAVSNLTRLLKLILERAIEAVGAEKGSLMLFDDATEELVIKVVFGLPDKDVERRINDGELACNRFRVGEGIAGKVFATGEAIRVDDTDEAPEFQPKVGSHVRTLICVPLVSDDEVIGVLNISNTTEGAAFEADDEEILGALADQAAVAITRARLYEAAITDGLTGLYIRRYALHRLREEIKKARRYGNPLGVVMCDIDHFKDVNDTWGHPAGDAALIAVGQTLSKGLRVDVDVVGRYGGEEFLLVLPSTDLEGAEVAAERLRAGIEELEPDIGGGRSLRLTVSFGVTQLGPEDTPESVLARADQAMYDAKSAGRNCVVKREA